MNKPASCYPAGIAWPAVMANPHFRNRPLIWTAIANCWTDGLSLLESMWQRAVGTARVDDVLILNRTTCGTTLVALACRRQRIKSRFPSTIGHMRCKPATQTLGPVQAALVQAFRIDISGRRCVCEHLQKLGRSTISLECPSFVCRKLTKRLKAQSCCHTNDLVRPYSRTYSTKDIRRVSEQLAFMGK